MRTWLLMFLLLLSILIHDAQGIRLSKGSLQAVEQQSNIHEKVSSNEEGIECRSKKSSGRIRKLITTMIHISSTTTTNAKKYDKNKEVKDGQRRGAVDSSSKYQQPQPETVDISEMDYSLQARRKPPIHN